MLQKLPVTVSSLKQVRAFLFLILFVVHDLMAVVIQMQGNMGKLIKQLTKHESEGNLPWSIMSDVHILLL